MIIKILLYIVVISISNTLGSISGMGGGTIIKPALQLFNYDSVLVINFYSALAVLTMSVSSTYKHIKKKTPINKKDVVILGIGATFGGIIGDRCFELFDSYVGNNISVVSQMSLVIVLLLLALFIQSSKIKPLNMSSSILKSVVGFMLGWFSTVLGIGGGPINGASFTFIFGMSVRQAAICSIATILFSQAAKILQIFLIGGLDSSIDILLSCMIVVSAFLAGLLGATISHKISENKILFLYKSMVVFILLLDFVNLVKYLFNL